MFHVYSVKFDVTNNLNKFFIFAVKTKPRKKRGKNTVTRRVNARLGTEAG